MKLLWLFPWIQYIAKAISWIALPTIPPKEKKRKMGDAVLGMSTQTDLRKLSSHPRGLEMEKGIYVYNIKEEKENGKAWGQGGSLGTVVYFCDECSKSKMKGLICSLKLEKKAVLLPVNSMQTYCQRNIRAQAKALVMAAAAFLNRALFHCCEGWT